MTVDRGRMSKRRISVSAQRTMSPGPEPRAPLAAGGPCSVYVLPLPAAGRQRPDRLCRSTSHARTLRAVRDDGHVEVAQQAVHGRWRHALQQLAGGTPRNVVEQERAARRHRHASLLVVHRKAAAAGR